MTERYPQKDAALQRCMDLSADLLRAAYDESKPIDRELAKGVAECIAYLLARVSDGECVPTISNKEQGQ